MPKVDLDNIRYCDAAMLLDLHADLQHELFPVNQMSDVDQLQVLWGCLQAVRNVTQHPWTQSGGYLERQERIKERSDKQQPVKLFFCEACACSVKRSACGCAMKPDGSQQHYL